MTPIRTTAAALLTLLAVAGAGAASAHADSVDRTVRAAGPTVVHDPAFTGVSSAVTAVSTGDGRTIVTLHLHDLPTAVRGATLGAHVHAGSCGSSPTASGPHYVNPDAPSTTPLHDREIWLDVAVNAAGAARATTVADWQIATGAARSVVVHANPTDHTSGAAGARLFCTDVAFGVAP